MWNIIIEGILSLFLVLIMAFIAYTVYNNEYISNIGDIIINSNKKSVPVFTGRFEFSNTQVNIETYNSNNLGYLNINPSRNQNGGAEYSYNFWLFFHLTNNKINDTASLTEKDYIILFFKGSNMKTMKYNNNGYECEEKGDKKLLIKNPLVKLRNDGKELLVEYNNINFPETYNNNASKINCSNYIDGKQRKDNNNSQLDEQLSKNKFGIKDINTEYYNDKFNMITIVFQENPSNEDVFNNNNANYRIYLNGELIEDKLANTNNIESSNSNYDDFKSRVIKNNNNKLNINPISYDNIERLTTNPDTYINEVTNGVTLQDQLTKIQPLQLADFTYFNYALNSSEINSLYRKGFHTHMANIKSNLALSSYDYSAKYINYPSRDLAKPI